MQDDQFGWLLAGGNIAVAIVVIMLTSVMGYDSSMMIG